MTKEDILNYFQDINFQYNDCTRYDSLSRMIDELIIDIADFVGGYTCTNSLELSDEILRKWGGLTHDRT